VLRKQLQSEREESMANIVFQNTALVVNPGLEDVLDPNGVIGTHTATEFEIVNTSGGASHFQCNQHFSDRRRCLAFGC
jgi:hypothetical protein